VLGKRSSEKARRYVRREKAAIEERKNRKH